MQIYEKNNTLVSFDEDNGAIISVCKLISTPADVDVTISDDEATFLRDEFDIDMGDYRQFKSDVDTANEIIRQCFMIESDEVMRSDDALSERGELATKIVNTIHGPYSRTENDDELAAAIAV